MSLLVLSEIFRLFIHTFKANDKYSLPNGENLPQPIQMQLSKKYIIWINFLLQIRNLHQPMKILRKKRSLTAGVFPKLDISKGVVR